VSHTHTPHDTSNSFTIFKLRKMTNNSGLKSFISEM
jgi:hypothetical protein